MWHTPKNDDRNNKAGEHMPIITSLEAIYFILEGIYRKVYDFRVKGINR